MANRNKRGEAARRNRKRNKDALYMSKFSDKYNKEQKVLLSRKNKELSNIPVKEGKINNPDYGKKGDLSMFKETKKTENKTKNKTEVKNKNKEILKKNSDKPKYKQVTQKELNNKIKERSKPKTKKRLSAREKLIAKNEARFGKAHVDKLRKKTADFKKMRSGKMSKEDFIKTYPKSITAQKHHGLRK